MSKPIEIRMLPDGPQKERMLAQIAAMVPPPRSVIRLLCGCVDPEVGPSVVRADGTCRSCSPR